MNIQLRDGESTQPYPDHVESVLEEGFIITCALNPTGTLLATGSNNGNIRVWDMETRRCAKVLRGHVGPVVTLSWAQTELSFASGGIDGTVRQWSAASEVELACIDVDLLVFNVCISPRTSTQMIADCHESPPFLLDMAAQHRVELRKILCENDEWPGGHSASCFHPTEPLAFIGTLVGKVHVVSLDEMRVVRVIPVCDRLIKSVALSRAGDLMIVNAERSVFVVNSETGAQFLPLKNRVDKMHWKACAMSGDGAYVATGTGDRQLHNIYIWDARTGTLVKTLEGPKSQSVLDVTWHPTQPVIVSVASSGLVYSWTVERTQSWSAFAPGFQELEYNVTYEEREDEFDLQSDEEGDGAKDAEDADDDVDVCTVDAGLCYLPGDHSVDPGFLCVAPVADDDASNDPVEAARMEVLRAWGRHVRNSVVEPPGT